MATLMLVLGAMVSYACLQHVFKTTLNISERVCFLPADVLPADLLVILSL